YSEVVLGWWRFERFSPTLDAYYAVWHVLTGPPSIKDALLNSFVIAVPSTIVPILVASLAAYSFARFSFRLRDMLFLTIVVLMSLPAQMVLIPIFFLASDVGLLDTRPGLILLHSSFGLPWIILFLRNFFLTLPVEVEEAARVDGASYFRIYWQIVIPMSIPALASIAALQFNWVWNDFLFALIFLHTPEKKVITQLLPMIRGRYYVRWDYIAATSIITMMVPILVFALLQKYYVKGIVTAIKG
ncbi:TPA: carbohydrate ABC transporter permease, partial [Candidatus Bathyarchaeota archaeon]|nr:carbohydrate ABC transporter permease [Candidatus Bathyarchaeota archaeon]